MIYRGRYIRNVVEVDENGKKKTAYYVICKYCGKEFDQKRKDSDKVYCSVECNKAGKKAILWLKRERKRHSVVDLEKAKKEVIPFICQFCGKEFFTYHQKIKKYTPKFCSNDCRQKAKEQRPDINKKLSVWGKMGALTYKPQTSPENVMAAMRNEIPESVDFIDKNRLEFIEDTFGDFLEDSTW